MKLINKAGYTVRNSVLTETDTDTESRLMAARGEEVETWVKQVKGLRSTDYSYKTALGM